MRVRRPQFKSPLCHFLAEWSWAVSLPSLSLSVFICYMGVLELCKCWERWWSQALIRGLACWAGPERGPLRTAFFLGLTPSRLPIQFVCVESLVTAVVDMYPKVFRRGYRRELLILALSIVSYFLGLVMLTEVSGVDRVAPELAAWALDQAGLVSNPGSEVDWLCDLARPSLSL